MNDISNVNQDNATALQPFEMGANQSLAAALSRVEIDQQISTAKSFPRSLDKVVKGVLSLATLDEESATECIYALPRGNKPIKGPSIRMAEIISSQWGNCRDGARVVHVDRVEKFVEAEGIFHDLETNHITTKRVRRRISDKNGKLLSDDMIIVTGNAACSIALRNAILGGVPKGVWRRAYEAVEKVITGDTKTLVERRELALKAFAAFGVKPERIFEALDVSGLDDIGVDQITILIGMHSALRNGEETVETMFGKAKSEKTAIENPLLPPKQPDQKPTESALNEAQEYSAADAFLEGANASDGELPSKKIEESPILLEAWSEGKKQNDQETFKAMA